MLEKGELFPIRACLLRNDLELAGEGAELGLYTSCSRRVLKDDTGNQGRLDYKDIIWVVSGVFDICPRDDPNRSP